MKYLVNNLENEFLVSFGELFSYRTIRNYKNIVNHSKQSLLFLTFKIFLKLIFKVERAEIVPKVGKIELIDDEETRWQERLVINRGFLINVYDEFLFLEIY